jgi:ATP-dependent exoDNAse (exonuclease V) beta subunit
VTEWAKSEIPNSKAEIADPAPGGAGQVEIFSLPEVEGRPTGRRFGTLVHASLAAVPLDADERTIDRIVGVQARIVAAPPDEVTAARQLVRAVLSHALLADARHAAEHGVLFRETPTTIVRDGQVLEGTVDLAFETRDGFTVIDFKTDRAEGDLLAVYVRQVQLYAEAIGQATGKPARALLMRV